MKKAALFPLAALLPLADDTPQSSPSTTQLNSTKLLFEQGPNGCAITAPCSQKPYYLLNF
jgi:hypothetical protein